MAFVFDQALASQAGTLLSLVTPFVLFSSLWLYNRKVLERHRVRRAKGDIQTPTTYAYGAIRTYPTATYWQMLEELFFIWYYWAIALWNNGFRISRHPLQNEDIVHSFLIPGINRRPRVVLSPLRDRGAALEIDWMGDWRKANKTTSIINAASFDYGGFGLLLHNSSAVLEQTLLKVPYMELRGTEFISKLAAHEGAMFLGFEYGHFVTSGYTMNLVAFPAMHHVAQQRGKRTVFLMDGSSHNSMMIGTYISTGAKILRFEHNNVDDLEAKLITSLADGPAEIIVGLEGNYSMEGGLPPLPAVITLKKKYAFKIYIDEAHSFLALGKTGRGIVEHYQDLGHKISAKDIDIIGATMSKSVGTIGGMLVMHDRDWHAAITQRIESMDKSGAGGQLPTVVKMRLMQIIRKPTLVAQRMNILRQHTVYILQSLHKAGLCVHSDYMSPVIVVITVSLSGCARFGAECHRLGLAVTMAGPPATAAWRSVGRLCINALLSPADVEELVRIVVKAAVNIGVVGRRAAYIANTLKYNFVPDNTNNDKIVAESLRVDGELCQILETQEQSNEGQQITLHAKSVLDHGVNILHTQGLGATSNRLYWGSLLAHVECEQKLANMYTSLTKYVPRGEVMSLIMTEARNTLSSTLSSCMTPCADKKAKHLVLISESASDAIIEAVKSMKVSPRVLVIQYPSDSALKNLIETHATSKTFVTIYRTTFSNGEHLDLAALVEGCTRAKTWRSVYGAQLLLDDFDSFGKHGPRKLGYLDFLEEQHGENYLSIQLSKLHKKLRFYLMGSFYNAFGLQGGFVIAEKDLIRLLHWTSRGSMFATAPLPCNVGMAGKMIEKLTAGNIGILKPSAIDEHSMENVYSLEDEVDSLGIASH